MAAPRPSACLPGSTSCRAARFPIRPATAGDGPRRLIARRPKLALVDELAHTNVPGSRHPKRWQDVEELLDEGIDVFATLNVQHLESLNDIIERISGVRVRETLPTRCSNSPTISS